LYTQLKWERGMLSLILAQVTIQVPMVAIIVRARLEVWAAVYEEAAADLGASPAKRFRMITIPMIRPGIIAGGLLAFTISLGDFVISYFTAGAGSRTVPLEVYRYLKDDRGDEIHALASILILASLCCAVAVAMLQRSRKLETVEYGEV
ncbi:MAG: ABC transporter permease, partial [Limisphaerales bacterium]